VPRSAVDPPKAQVAFNGLLIGNSWRMLPPRVGYACLTCTTAVADDQASPATRGGRPDEGVLHCV
jgi:hypothetical protein